MPSNTAKKFKDAYFTSAEDAKWCIKQIESFFDLRGMTALEPAVGSGIFVTNAAAEIEKPEQLYFSRRRAPFYLYWAPNSQTISFLANDTTGMALHLVPADGSDESEPRTIHGGRGG